MTTSPAEFRYAIESGPDPVELVLELVPDPRDAPASPLALTRTDTGETVTLTGVAVNDLWVYRIPVPGATPGTPDDAVHFRAGYAVGAVRREVQVECRRTTCTIDTALVERRGDAPLWEQTRAALLWHAHGKFQSIHGLKRFTNGLSGNDVFVFRPRLKDGAGTDATTPAWGSDLLVKTGSSKSLHDEYKRYHQHLANRAHPFMARTDALLSTLPADPGEQADEEARAKARDRVTLIGSFLGGELLRVEPFEAVLRGAADPDRGAQVVDAIASVLAAWHAGSVVRPLGSWDRVYRDGSGDEGKGKERGFPPLMPAPWLPLKRARGADEYGLPTFKPGSLRLFDRYDLTTSAGRADYKTGLQWDDPFAQTEHLHDHLVGKTADGLLYRLMAMPVRFSLTHGDLHPRNVLAGRDAVWLLDFGETGYGPTMYDLTKLEVYLRLWCLDLRPTDGDIDDAAADFEALLLDHLTGTEGGVGAVAEFADDLGGQPHELVKVATAIARIRARATEAHQSERADHRDYLAVLYLTVLETLRYAGDDSELAENYRLLMALSWLLEDTLSRFAGLDPHPRGRVEFDPRHLVTAAWLAAPGAPARVRYLIDRDDGRRALAPVAAARGVLQNPEHYLDVFDHTLLVLGYLEALVDGDLVAALFDPARFDDRVDEAMRKQGLTLLHIPTKAELGTEVPQDAVWDYARQLVRERLDAKTVLELKWAALFHDVGKPATRFLNVGKKGRRVQFIGHEAYSLQLVSGHLELYFPDAAQRDRISNLILKHHARHKWVQRYKSEKKKEFAALAAAEALEEIPWDEVKYLATFWEPSPNTATADYLMLLVHGFADVLAGRGPGVAVSLAESAAVDRAVLRAYAMYMHARAELAPAFDAHVAHAVAAGVEASADLVDRLRPWFVHQTRSLAARGQPELTPAGFLKQAKQMAE